MIIEKNEELKTIYNVYKNIRNSFHNVIKNEEIVELVHLRLKNKGYSYTKSQLENILNSLYYWHFENFNFKQMVNYLIDNNFNFELKTENEISIITVYNMYEVHYYNYELDFLNKHEI